MSCSRPLSALYRVDAEGKKRIVFNPCNREYIIRGRYVYNQPILIPCGQCIDCRLEYSRQWAIRCQLEAKQWKTNYFLTLTYDDEHIPMSSSAVLDDSSGEVLGEFPSMTLRPRDLQLFLKHLRQNIKRDFDLDGVRFFACGEYGTETHRPHYHLILFNMPELPDLVLYKKNFQGDSLYNSSYIDKIWKKGYSVIGQVTWETCAYVGRYMLKKHKGKDRDYYELRGLAPEFSRCSRRPGIGFSYYDQKKSHIYDFDEIVVPAAQGKVLRCKPPKYYDRLFGVDDLSALQAIKDHRQHIADVSMEHQLARTSLSQMDYLRTKGEILQNKINSCKRL